ncbi:hypothetical protein FQR65_LT00838 [Abscondita terminalis]|nr:hypothetical protein FQR65_LT00838 [Abscondita terminalis]
MGQLVQIILSSLVLSIVDKKVAAVPSAEINLSITADVLTLLMGSFDDIPITYIDDIGNELNELLFMGESKSKCGKYAIKEATRTTISDLKTLAKCLIADTKHSTNELPVSMNSVLQTVTSLLDHSLIVVRFVGTSLSKDHESKCAELIPKIEAFVSSVDECVNIISQACIERALADEEMKSAIYCIL